MNEKNLQTGGDKNKGLIYQVRLILISFARKTLNKEDTEAVRQGLKVFDSPYITNESIDLKLKKILEIDKKISVNIKRLVLVGAVIGTMLVGVGVVVASRIIMFNRNSQQNRIEYNSSGTTTEIQKIDSNNKTYDSVEALEQDLQCSIPLLTEFPEELTATTIQTESYGDIIIIRMTYENSENDKKVDLTYQYFKIMDNSTSVYGSDPRYSFEGEFDILGNTVTLFSSMDRCTAYWTYGNFTILIEAKYNKNVVEEMLQKIKI